MPIDQESPPAENEATSKDSSSTVQNLTQDTAATNEPKTGSKPDNDSSVAQVENDATSKNSTLPPNEGVNNPEEDDTGTSKQSSANEAHPRPHEIKPAENEASKDSDDTTHAAETSNASPPSAEDVDASKISSPPDDDPTQEAGGTKTSSRDSDPSVGEIPPAQNESASQNPLPPEDNVSQTTESRSQETEDTEASKRDSATLADTTPIENTTISEESSPPKDDLTQSTQTTNQEIDYTNAIEDHPPEQDVTPSENEATTRDASSTNNVPTQSTASGTPEEVPDQETAMKDVDSRPLVNEISSEENVNNTVKRSSSSPTDFGNKVDSSQKKSSIWKKVRCLFFKRNKKPSPQSSGEITTTKSVNSGKGQSEELLIKADIDSVDNDTKALKNFNERLIGLNDEARQELSTKKGNYKELRNSMIKLKLMIPSKIDVDSGAFKDLQSRLKSRESIPQDLLKSMPQLHKNETFYRSPEVEYFKALYERLVSEVRLCLLCFSIFPGNETIRKRLMVRWWLAEGLSNEEEANKHFDKLREDGFIVPVNNNRSPSIGRYQMHPLYQSMLTMLAEEAKFFNFDEKGKPTQRYTNSFQACLVGDGLLSYDDLKQELVSVDGLEKIHLLMNVEESILDFKPHWFSMMRNVNVLYLGRWQASDAAHIEVEETNFLDELKNMNSIKFLSLQGISNIIKLTDSILALKRLECLDLRACHNLEAIPSRIGSLTRLTHLDMSECFLLDHMPKSLSKLKNLRVFKGFVVTEKNSEDSCTLADLKELKNLTKLCIYTTSKHFPDSSQVSCLEDLTELLKLSIAWGGEALKEETKDDNKRGTLLKATPFLRALAGGREASKEKTEAGGDTIKEEIVQKSSKLPSKLEKLDLKCFPLKDTPSWLKMANFKSLKKLYIRGGPFSDLGQYQCADDSHISPREKDAWKKVEVLRLKYLCNLEMEWRQLHELFPELVYLEQISCPKLTIFNCGAFGVWINPTIGRLGKTDD